MHVISPTADQRRGKKQTARLPLKGSSRLTSARQSLIAGMALLSGFSGQHAVRRIEAAALIPYPPAGDICVDGVWMSEAPQNVRIIDVAVVGGSGSR
jgi:hypothetical protein